MYWTTVRLPTTQALARILRILSLHSRGHTTCRICEIQCGGSLCAFLSPICLRKSGVELAGVCDSTAQQQNRGEIPRLKGYQCVNRENKQDEMSSSNSNISSIETENMHDADIFGYALWSAPGSVRSPDRQHSGWEKQWVRAQSSANPRPIIRGAAGGHELGI